MAVTKIFGLLTLALSVLAAPSGPEKSASFVARQAGKSPNWYKYWANDKAEVEAQNLDGGKFALTWDEPSGGNFVIGKGYQTGFDT